MKLKSGQSEYYRGQIKFVRRIAYRYGDTYTGDQGVTFLPTLQKIASSQFPCRCENNIFNPRAEKLRVHDTSAAHSDIYKELGMEKYWSELTLTDWKQ